MSAEGDTCAQAAPFTQRRCKHTLRIRRRRTDGSHDPHAVIAQRLQHLKVAQHVVPAAWALGHRDAGNHRRTHPSVVVRENKVRPAFRPCSSQPMVGAWSFSLGWYMYMYLSSPTFLYFVKLSPKSPDRRTYGCGYHRHSPISSVTSRA